MNIERSIGRSFEIKHRLYGAETCEYLENVTKPVYNRPVFEVIVLILTKRIPNLVNASHFLLFQSVSGGGLSDPLSYNPVWKSVAQPTL